MNNALKKSINQIFKIALQEDKTLKDISSKLLLNKKNINVEIRFKSNGVLCGTNIIDFILKCYNKGLKAKWKYKDGSKIKKNTVVGIISGPSIYLISLERIILNFLQRLCGISTLTDQYVRKVKKGIKILDTRKTIPGWRLLEKYAVKTGGGTNHRKDLKSSYLIKDNHIQVAGGIVKTLEIAKEALVVKNLEIEVSSIAELKKALDYKPKVIMLDNFNVDNIKKSVQLIRMRTKSKIEVSGNVTIEKINEIKNLDIDYISVGKITHSANFLDISMNVLK